MFLWFNNVIEISVLNHHKSLYPWFFSLFRTWSDVLPSKVLQTLLRDPEAFPGQMCFGSVPKISSQFGLPRIHQREWCAILVLWVYSKVSSRLPSWTCLDYHWRGMQEASCFDFWTILIGSFQHDRAVVFLQGLHPDSKQGYQNKSTNHILCWGFFSIKLNLDPWISDVL